MKSACSTTSLSAPKLFSVKLNCVTKGVLRSLGKFAFLGLLCATCNTSPAIAEEAAPKSTAVSTATLPPDLPPIPGPSDSEAALYITRSNAALFHEVLLAPIASWLKDGLLMTRVVRSLAFNWELAADWEASSISNVGRFDIDSSGGLLLLNQSPLAGYPFGRAEQINQEPDPQRRAYKVLWNLTFAESPSVDLLHEIELQWMSLKGVSRSASGLFYRRMKSGLGASSATSSALDKASSSACEGASCAAAEPESSFDPFREEVLHLKTPPVVLGFTMIGRRYLGVKDDDVWIHSPVTGRSRHVFSSNRSDPILGGVLTFDDFFVWSGKVQSFAARVVEEKTLLVPFPTLRAVEVSKLRTGSSNLPPATLPTGTVPGLPPAVRPGWGGLFNVPELFTRRDSSATNMLWNVDTGKFPQAASWVPSAMVFVPRRVWIIELSPRDPFYLSGRQILVVDQESMLPVYKVVYDRSGNYKKTVIGGWALSTTADAKVRFPFAAFVLTVKADGQMAMAATSSAVETFLGNELGRSREVTALLDIDSFASKESAKSSKESTKTDSAAPPKSVTSVSSAKSATVSSVQSSALAPVAETEQPELVEDDSPQGLEIDDTQPED